MVKCLWSEKTSKLNSSLWHGDKLTPCKPTPEEFLEALLCNSFPLDNQGAPVDNSFESHGKHLASSVVRQDKIVAVVKSLKAFKSVGPHGFQPYYLHHS